jgi:hypothetical protein
VIFYKSSLVDEDIQSGSFLELLPRSLFINLASYNRVKPQIQLHLLILAIQNLNIFSETECNLRLDGHTRNDPDENPNKP